MMDFKLYHRITPNDPLIDYIVSRGVDPTPLRHYLGQDISLPEQKIGFVSWQNFCLAHERAAEILEDPYFGLKYGLLERDDFRITGPMVYLLSSAINVRQFISIGLDYQRLHTNAIHYSYEEDAENQEVTGVFTFNPIAGSHRQLVELVLTLLCELGRSYLPNITFKRVTFQHRAPDDMEWYEKAFQAPVTFNAERTTLTADIKYLDMDRSSFLNSAIQKSLKIYLDRKLKQHPYAEKTIRGTLTEALPSLIGIKQTDIESVAYSLGVHSKKMQRLLKDEGTSYSDVLDEVRKGLAERLLVDSDISIERIAKMLDYSSDRALTTAMKRWFGISAIKYRNESKR